MKIIRGIEIHCSPSKEYRKLNKASWGQCVRKIRYKTEQRALRAIKKLRKRCIVVHTPYVYHCEVCRGFHLTKMPQA